MKLLLYSSNISTIDFDKTIKPCESVELIIDEDYPNMNSILSLIEYCIHNQIVYEIFELKNYEGLKNKITKRL